MGGSRRWPRNILRSVPRKVTVRAGVPEILADTQRMVTRLVAENRALKAQNQKLAAELTRLSKGWEMIKALARQAPRKNRR
jgi:cell division protein FtsB